MGSLYEKILFFAGDCYKSSNPVAHALGNLVLHFLVFVFQIKDYDRQAILDEIALQLPERANDKAYIKKVTRAYFRYKAWAREYILLDFEHKTRAEIKEYLLTTKKKVLVTFINSRQVIKLFNAKEMGYELFRDFYKRDAMYFGHSLPKREAFYEFAQKHPEFICKPSNLSCGRGIEKICVTPNKSLDDYYNEIASKAPAIIETFLYNDESIAAFHRNSLNIVRIVAFRLKNGDVKPMRAYFDMGVGGKEFTNVTTGTVTVQIDPQTGVTYGIGVEERINGRFEKHPDTGLDLAGFQMPRWDEALELVQKLMDVIPEAKYVGWDLALTPDGWVLVEGNGNADMFLYQLTSGKSIWDEFMSYYKQT